MSGRQEPTWTVGERVHAVGTVARLDDKGHPIVMWDSGDDDEPVLRHGELPS